MISHLKEQIKEKQVERKILSQSLLVREKELEDNSSLLIDLETAKAIFQRAAKVTQRFMEQHLSNVVTKALAVVFTENPYTFRTTFVERRNVTECDMVFVRDDKEKDPLDSCGYGAADIASFALRVAYWKLDGTSTNTLFLDEPFRNLSAEFQPLASLMVSKLSKMLNLQFIIVTHNVPLSEYADKVYSVSRNVYSKVKEVK